MARAKSKSKPKPTAKRTAAQTHAAKAETKASAKAGAPAVPPGFPYLHIGHGSSRCSDDFSIWLLFADEVAAADRTAIEDAMPEPLRDQARSEDGTLVWAGPLLFVNSGVDFKYFVASYDDNYLAWQQHESYRQDFLHSGLRNAAFRRMMQRLLGDAATQRLQDIALRFQ